MYRYTTVVYLTLFLHLVTAFSGDTVAGGDVSSGVTIAPETTTHSVDGAQPTVNSTFYERIAEELLAGVSFGNDVNKKGVEQSSAAAVKSPSSHEPKAYREGRRIKGGILRRLALPLLILLGLKAGLTVPIIFGGVALAAFKGLWTGSTALLVTAALALRGLIPPPKVILAHHGGAHAHVTDYLADYRRADDYRDDYNRYTGYGWK